MIIEGMSCGNCRHWSNPDNQEDLSAAIYGRWSRMNKIEGETIYYEQSYCKEYVKEQRQSTFDELLELFDDDSTLVAILIKEVRRLRDQIKKPGPKIA